MWSVSTVAYDTYEDVKSLAYSMGNICYVDSNNSTGVFGLINSVSIVANDAYHDLLSFTEKITNLSLSYYNVSTFN